MGGLRAYCRRWIYGENCVIAIIIIKQIASAIEGEADRVRCCPAVVIGCHER